MWYNRGGEILSKITNVGFHGKALIFFYFCDLDFIDYYLNFWWYSRKCDQKKLKLWWYSWKAKKRPPLRPSSPAWAPGGFNLFYSHFRETTRNSNDNE